MTISAVVLAGGLGTRLRDVVSDRPKPMALIGDRPFLDYLLDYWRAQGVERFILSVGYRHEAIVSHFRSEYRGAAIEYVIEDRPLGTGGGVLLAARNISASEYFLLLNGDTFFEVPLRQLVHYAQSNDADCCFSLFRSNEDERYMALNLTGDGRIESLQSNKGSIGSLANGGVYCLRRRALLEEQFSPGLKWSLENDILPMALTTGRCLFGLEFPGTFIDIGVPDDYARAAQVLNDIAVHP